jgi:hypothetical protein
MLLSLWVLIFNALLLANQQVVLTNMTVLPIAIETLPLSGDNTCSQPHGTFHATPTFLDGSQLDQRVEALQALLPKLEASFRTLLTDSLQAPLQVC